MMAKYCKQCCSLGIDTVLRTDDEAIAHASIHYQQQRLVDPFTMSVDEFIETQFETERKVSLITPQTKARESIKSLYSFAAEQVKKKFSSNPVQCDECFRKIQVFRKDGAIDSIATAVSHACIHLEKPLFACHHCDKQVTRLRSMRAHVRTAHKLTGRSRLHYRDLSGPYLEEIKDMIARCFGQLKRTEIQDSTRDIPITKNRTLRQYCLALLEKRNIGDRLTCTKCAQVIRFPYGPTGAKATSALVHHACLHLDKPVFTCTHCEHKCVCLKSIQSHLMYSHRLSFHRDHYIDATIKYQTEIMEIIECCFGNNAKNSTSTSKRKKNYFQSTPFSKFCLSLNADKDGRAACSKCGCKLKFHTKANCSWILINHACRHLNKFLYACRQCDLQFCTKSRTCDHLREAHALNGTSDNYIDSTDIFKKEIMDTLAQCFGQEDKGRNEERPLKRFFRKCRYSLHHACHSMLSHHPRDAKVKCSLCSKMLQVYSGNCIATQAILNHALGHFDKPIFTCRHCQHSAATETRIREHLGKHGLPSEKKHFIDGTSEYRDEIIALLQRCFGGNTDK